jgi:hypothetical protein
MGTSDPLRCPDDPSSSWRRSPVAIQRPSRASPTDTDYLSGVLSSLPRWTVWVLSGYRNGAFPRGALPHPPSPVTSRVGAHISAFEACSSFTRVTARRIARQPKVDLSRGFDQPRFTRTYRPPAIESNHQLFEWVLPPLVISPLGAHQRPSALPGIKVKNCWWN